MSRNRIKRAAAEAAGWLCALAVWIVVAAMECGVLRPLAGGALGLGLELIGALALCKAGVVRTTGELGIPSSAPCGGTFPQGKVRGERW